MVMQSGKLGGLPYDVEGKRGGVPYDGIKQVWRCLLS